MTVFLAPVPVEHIQAMFSEIALGRTRFAFGSNAIGLAEELPRQMLEKTSLEAFLYVSQTGIERTPEAYDLHLGITIQATLVGWSMADKRGKYAGNPEYRPISTNGDGAMLIFWEIDQIRRLSGRISMARFGQKSNGRPLVDRTPYYPQFVQRRK